MTTFERINYWIRNSETSLVNLLSALAPWLAPLAPAFMSYYHMDGVLDFPGYVAMAVAIVVEILGLSAISTILAFWTYNRRRVAEYRKAPVFLAVFSFVFYLAIVLVINVMLDAAKIPDAGMNQDWVIVLARAMLTLLSVPAAIILAVRTQHKETLDQAERERIEKRAAKTNKPPVLQSKGTVEAKTSMRKRRFLDDFRRQAIGGDISVESIAEQYGVSTRTAYRWLEEINNE